ncbi:MAG TPA: winged helix DNA-binding domain-containing protein, partial [Aggregatilineales bacterium]|nr:winged helix DNA-binding domain-containing protein [Aggregatilineales bacterium]
RCEKLVVDAMTGGTILTRADIFALFDKNGISTEGQRGYHILWHLAHLGVVCMAPMKGKEQTFVLLDEWVKNLRELSHDEALTELVYRYFASHGPATDYDFARWSGLTLTDTRTGIKNNDTRLQSVKIGDTAYWMEITPLQADVGQVYLLPGYDEYFIGYQDRQAIIADEHAQKVVPGNNGVFQPIIVVDGQVVGTWKHKIKRNALEMTFYPFTTIDHVADSINAEAKDFAHFIGADFHP